MDTNQAGAILRNLGVSLIFSFALSSLRQVRHLSGTSPSLRCQKCHRCITSSCFHTYTYQSFISLIRCTDTQHVGCAIEVDKYTNEDGIGDKCPLCGHFVQDWHVGNPDSIPILACYALSSVVWSWPLYYNCLYEVDMCINVDGS